MKQLSILAMVLAATVAFSAHAVAADTLMGDPKKDSSSVRRMCTARSVEAKKAVLAREAGVPLDAAKRKGVLPVYVLRNIYDETTMSVKAQAAYAGWACIAESRYIAPSLGFSMVEDFSECEEEMRSGADATCWEKIRKEILHERDIPPPMLTIISSGDGASKPVERAPAFPDDRVLPPLPVAMGKAMVKRLETQCELYPTMRHYQGLRELLAMPQSPKGTDEFSFQMVFGASKWVDFVEPAACGLAILQNMNDGIGFYLEKGPEHGHYKTTLMVELAYARYVTPLISGSQDYQAAFKEGSELVTQSIELSSKRPWESSFPVTDLFERLLKLKLSAEQRKLVLSQAIDALELRKQSVKKPEIIQRDQDKLRRELQALQTSN